jgi:hypothetical protein
VDAHLKRLGALPAVLLGALLLRAVAGVGFANYDTLYALVWGQQLAHGHTPQYGIPVAPTPHPLVEALGVVLSPLGPRAMQSVTVALAFIALAGLGWVMYRLGALWFGRAAGALSAVLLLTRVPVVSYGVRAYVDVPYLLLVLCAVFVAVRPPGEPAAEGEATASTTHPGAPPLPEGGASTTRQSAAAPSESTASTTYPSPPPALTHSPWLVLALLALAGLLRPEAWVFSGLYWLYLALRAGYPRPQLARLALLACAAPLVWLLSDLLVTGSPLWSLTNTRATARELDRVTGIAHVPEYIPRRLGEILRPPVLVGAALGGVLSLAWLPARTRAREGARIGAAVGVVAVVVFAAFATAGLPINTRYAFLGAAVLCLFCGAGVCGWTQLPAGDSRRRWWMAGGALVAVALLAYAPAQYRSLHKELDALARQQSIQHDLVALVHSGAVSLRCGEVGVPNHRPIPLLALELAASPVAVVSAQERTLARGTYLQPATRAVEETYILDLHDPGRLTASVPPGFALAEANRSWRVYRRCV